MEADIVDFGTKWKNVPGTRDQMIKFEWDQGPNGKNWLGPGTIGPPIQSLTFGTYFNIPITVFLGMAEEE